MAARFSEAILNEIRNRELLAQALAEQQREQMRRRAILRGILAAAPLAISVYLLSNEPLPEIEALERLKAMFGGKKILNEVGAQLEKSDQVMIAAKPQLSPPPANYAREETDEILDRLEARQEALAEFVAKAPRKTLSETKLLEMADRAENGQNAVNGADTKELSTMAEGRMRALADAAEEAPLGNAPSPMPPPESAARAPASIPLPWDETKYEMIPAEELLRRVPEVAIQAPMGADYRPSDAGDLERIALPVRGAVSQEYERKTDPFN